MQEQTLLYDADCPMCVLGARLARAPGVRVRPYQAQGLPAGLDLAACRGEIKLVDAGGVVHSGADALREVLRRRAATRPLAWALALPGAMPLTRALYAVVARNRRAIAPTARNVLFPRAYYGETWRSTLAFLALTFGVASVVTFVYGASAAPLLGMGPWASAACVTAAAAAGWAVSLPIVMGLGWLWITCADTLRQGACVMVAGVLPLVPLAIVNFALGPSEAANLVVLAADGLWMLGVMTWRLRLYGLPPQMAALWFAALEAGGIGACWLLAR